MTLDEATRSREEAVIAHTLDSGETTGERAEPRDDQGAQGRRTVLARLYHALGPIAGALVLDFADLVTLGPLGIFGGLPIGALVGWWLGGLYGLGNRLRAAFSLVAGFYCMAPWTHAIPVATVFAALARFLEEPPERGPGPMA